MKLRRWIAGVGAVTALAVGSPANAAAPTVASCPGQELSAVAPVFRVDLGGFIAFEAQNPELEGWDTFGEEISTFALSDRADCPEE